MPAGDKPCLAEPVNFPESLGTCPHHINWCMHLQQHRLVFAQQKNSVAAISGLVKFDFKAIWIIVLWGQCIWWGAERENTDAAHALSLRATCAHILLCCRNPSQFRRTLFITLKKIPVMYNYSGVYMTGPRWRRAACGLCTCRMEKVKRVFIYLSIYI